MAEHYRGDTLIDPITADDGTIFGVGEFHEPVFRLPGEQEIREAGVGLALIVSGKRWEVVEDERGRRWAERAATYLCQKLDKGYILGNSGEVASFAEAIRWAIAQGDGSYLTGPAIHQPWAAAPAVQTDWDSGHVCFEVRGGAISPPVRSDWEHAACASERLIGRGPRVLRDTTLWVIEPGDLSAQGLFRDPGTCLARRVLPGDRILDTLEVRVTREGLEVHSTRQQSDDYDWTPAGPRFNRERRTVAKVRIGGRAGAWGTLGDDSYDPGSADAILSDTLAEAVMGDGEWQIAPIYYESQEVSREECSPYDPIARVDLSHVEWAEGSRLAVTADLSRAEDLRPIRILDGGAE